MNTHSPYTKGSSSRSEHLAGALDVDGLVGLLVLGAEGTEGDGLVGGPVAASLQALEHRVVEVVRAGVAVVAGHNNYRPYGGIPHIHIYIFTRNPRIPLI